MQAVSRTLNSTELAGKYINYKAKRYISRGHLTAKADFVYGSLQASTFWYVNITRCVCRQSSNFAREALK